jgi:hypothetical protein
MNYTHYDLGGLGKGRTVEVILQGNSANVYLMDHDNMANYVKGKPFMAIGGLMTFSPIRMQTIDEAHWHLVIDLPKGFGKVKTAYRMLSKQPPNISTRPAIFKPTEAQIRAVEADKAASLSAAKAAAKPEKPPEPPKPPGAVTCNRCGILTRPGKFCTDCGEPIERTCIKCGTANTLTCKFCSECGSKLG